MFKVLLQHFAGGPSLLHRTSDDPNVLDLFSVSPKGKFASALWSAYLDHPGVCGLILETRSNRATCGASLSTRAQMLAHARSKRRPVLVDLNLAAIVVSKRQHGFKLTRRD